MNRKKSGVNVFNKWNERLRRALKNSLPVRMMTLLGGLEERADKGFFVTRIKKLSESLGKRFDLRGRISRPARIAFSREMEQSALLHLAERVIGRSLGAPLRAYGLFLLTFSFYAILLSSASSYLAGQGWLNAETMVMGVVGLLCPLPLLFASKETTLASGLLQSRICSYLLFDLLGLEKEPFEKKREQGNGILAGFLLGMALAALTPFLSVKSLLLAAFLPVFLCISYVRPESAVLLCAIGAPFLSGSKLRLMLVVAAFFFLIKLLRGKRNLKLGVYTIAMLVYGGWVLFCGIVCPAGVGFEETGNLLTVLLAFFLPAVLFCRKEWISAASGALCLGAAIAALGGVFLFVADFVPAEYRVFLPFVETLEGCALYKDASYGVFAALAFPVFAVRLLTETRIRRRMSSMLLLALFALAAVLSRDLGVWIVLGLSLVLMLIFTKNISIYPLLAVLGVGAPVYIFLLPEGIKNAVADYCNGFSADFSAVSSSFAESARRFFAGIGIGSGAEGGNLYSGLLTEQGAAGVVLLLFAFVGVLSYATYAVYNTEGADRVSLTLTGGFSVALIGALTLGLFTDLFAKDDLTFLVFFLAGTLWACAKALCWEAARSVRRTEIDRDYLFEPIIRREKGTNKNKKGRKSRNVPAKEQAEGLQMTADDGTSSIENGQALPTSNEGEDED